MEIFYKSTTFEFSLKLEAMILITLLNLLVSSHGASIKEMAEATLTVLSQILAFVGWL